MTKITDCPLNSSEVKERDAVSVTEKSSSDEKIIVEVSDNLPDSIFNFPLSIRRPLPDAWETSYVTQNEEEIEDTIIIDGSKKYILFKAVPDGGDVVITETVPTAVKKSDAGINGIMSTSVTLVKNILKINTAVFNAADVSVSLFDISGKVLVKKIVSDNNLHVALPVEHLSRSAIIAVVSGSGKQWRGIITPGIE